METRINQQIQCILHHIEWIEGKIMPLRQLVSTQLAGIDLEADQDIVLVDTMLVAPTAVVQPMEVAQEARPQLLE
jgi:hypothetical protein